MGQNNSVELAVKLTEKVDGGVSIVKSPLQIAEEEVVLLTKAIELVQGVNSNISEYLTLINWEPRKRAGFVIKAFNKVDDIKKSLRFAKFEVQELTEEAKVAKELAIAEEKKAQKVASK